MAEHVVKPRAMQPHFTSHSRRGDNSKVAGILGGHRSDIERQKINARERQRMHQLNRAMEDLRQVLPQAPGVCKLSKMSTLQAARNCILTMSSTISELQQLITIYQTSLSMPSHIWSSLNRYFPTRPASAVVVDTPSPSDKVAQLETVQDLSPASVEYEQQLVRSHLDVLSQLAVQSMQQQSARQRSVQQVYLEEDIAATGEDNSAITHQLSTSNM